MKVKKPKSPPKPKVSKKITPTIPGQKVGSKPSPFSTKLEPVVKPPKKKKRLGE